MREKHREKHCRLQGCSPSLSPCTICPRGSSAASERKQGEEKSQGSSHSPSLGEPHRGLPKNAPSPDWSHGQGGHIPHTDGCVPPAPWDRRRLPEDTEGGRCRPRDRLSLPNPGQTPPQVLGKTWSCCRASVNLSSWKQAARVSGSWRRSRQVLLLVICSFSFFFFSLFLLRRFFT